MTSLHWIAAIVITVVVGACAADEAAQRDREERLPVGQHHNASAGGPA